MPVCAQKAIKVAASVLSVGALLGVIWLGWGQLREAASLHRHWRLIWLAAAAFAQLLVYCCIAAMFRLSFGSRFKLLSFPFLLYCAVAFLFANRALPGPALVGVATLVYLMRGKNVSAVDAQAAAGSFYVADYAGFFAIIAAVSFPLFAEQPNRNVRLIYLVSLSLIGLITLAIIAAFFRPKPLARFIGNVVGLVMRPIVKQDGNAAWPLRAEHFVQELHDRITSAVRTPGQLIGYFLLSTAMHVAEVATIVFAGRASGIFVSGPISAAAYAAGNLASIVSVLPGGVGFYEAGMIGTLHEAGHLSLGDATVCALIYRVLSFWAPLPAIVGVVAKVTKEGIWGGRKSSRPVGLTDRKL